MPTLTRLNAVCAALAACALATAAPAPGAPAEPAPPPPPAPAPTGLLPALAGVGNALAQAGSAPTGPLGLPDLSAYGPHLLLGQNPVPAAPGQAPPVSVPSFDAFNPDYLVPLNIAPAAPGEGTPADGLGPTAENPGTGRIAFLRRLYEMYQSGNLDGALLGQLPKDADGRPILPPEAPADVG